MYMYINTHTSNDSHIFSLKEVGNSSTMCMSLCSRVGLRFLKSPSIISSGRRALWTSSISLCEVSAINWKGEGGRGGRGGRERRERASKRRGRRKNEHNHLHTCTLWNTLTVHGMYMYTAYFINCTLSISNYMYKCTLLIPSLPAFCSSVEGQLMALYSTLKIFSLISVKYVDAASAAKIIHTYTCISINIIHLIHVCHVHVQYLQTKRL